MCKNNSKLVKTLLTPLQYIFWLGYAVCINSSLSQLEKNLILLMIWIHQGWLYIKAKRFPPQYCMIKIFRMTIKEVGWIEIRALTKAVFLKMLSLLLRCEWVHVYLFCSKLDDMYKGNSMGFFVINIPAGIFSVINQYPTRSWKNSTPVISSVFLFIFFLLWLLSVPSSVCLCSDSKHYFYPPHRRQRLSRGRWTVSPCGWSGLTLCVHRIMTEIRCDGGRKTRKRRRRGVDRFVVMTPAAE